MLLTLRLRPHFELRTLLLLLLLQALCRQRDVRLPRPPGEALLQRVCWVHLCRSRCCLPLDA